jgi:hypothetical protein
VKVFYFSFIVLIHMSDYHIFLLLLLICCIYLKSWWLLTNSNSRKFLVLKFLTVSVSLASLPSCHIKHLCVSWFQYFLDLTYLPSRIFLIHRLFNDFVLLFSKFIRILYSIPLAFTFFCYLLFFPLCSTFKLILLSYVFISCNAS